MTTLSRDARDPARILGAARALIAREVLDAELAPATLGEITLHPHQRRAVARVRRLLRLAGGAMLADATGLGKTFVALAAGADVERLLIVAPASLVDAWRYAAERAGVEPGFVSMERLSRGAAPALTDPELVIIDEAHHFRNPRTRRYSAVAEICDRSRVLLLSATPLQNRRADLVAELALFLGDAAAAASDEELARFVVRRRAADAGLRLPAVIGPERVELPVADDLLDLLVALPPPVPGRDEGEAAALVAYTLLRQWSSSRAALTGGLRRRLAKALALTTSLEAGRWPSRGELEAWSCADDGLQLALPELLSPLGSGGETQWFRTLLDAVCGHADAIRAVLARVRETPDPDSARAAAIDEICRAHQETRVIAFSQYADTVHAIARLLMSRRAGVAELSAHGGRVAGGRISRRDVLAQFAPGAGRTPAADCERISLLVTTDVLSEGLDLQRASVIVHLDLPWNPARLEQRVGRVRRLGSAHDTVHVYALSPPASAERVLRVEARLRDKLRLASDIIGLDSVALDGAPTVAGLAPPELASDALALLERWRDEDDSGRAEPTPVVAGVLAPNDGLLVLLAAGEDRLLLAAADGGDLRLDAALVARVIASGDGMAITPTAEEEARATRAVHTWSSVWTARKRLVRNSPAGAHTRSRLAGRIADLLATAPRHERAALGTLASRARRVLGVPLGAAAERMLAALAGVPLADAATLEAIAALGERRDARESATPGPRPLAVIVLRRAGPSD